MGNSFATFNAKTRDEWRRQGVMLHRRGGAEASGFFRALLIRVEDGVPAMVGGSGGVVEIAPGEK